LEPTEQRILRDHFSKMSGNPATSSIAIQAPVPETAISMEMEGAHVASRLIPAMPLPASSAHLEAEGGMPKSPFQEGHVA
jgi:hypothetical protein